MDSSDSVLGRPKYAPRKILDWPAGLAEITARWGPNTQLIFTDEAGTSAPEPVRVVASVIVGAEQHDSVAAQLWALTDQHVPEALREGYRFHGKELFQAKRLTDRHPWSLGDRLAFFEAVLRLIQANDLPLAVGKVFAGMGQPEHWPKKVTDVEYEHLRAFGYCADRADLYLRKYHPSRQSGVLIVEDDPDRRRMLASAGLFYRENPHSLDGRFMRPSVEEERTGATPAPGDFRIERIVDQPHFAPKTSAPLLQLADACAFTFRRALSNQPAGSELMHSLLGDQASHVLSDPRWFSGASSDLFLSDRIWMDWNRRRRIDEAVSASMIALWTGR